MVRYKTLKITLLGILHTIINGQYTSTYQNPYIIPYVAAAVDVRNENGHSH